MPAADPSLAFPLPREGERVVALRIGDSVGVIIGVVVDGETISGGGSAGGCGRRPSDPTVIAQAHLRAATGLDDLSISRRPSGRPRLAPPYPELGVSLSARDGLLLAGVSTHAAVGVDLEVDTPGLDPASLAADHFATGEADAIAAHGPDAARDLFLRLWVAKEAVLKISGRGVYDGLAAPDLSGHLERLADDGAVLHFPATATLPALRLATRRLATDGRPAIFCALAVADG